MDIISQILTSVFVSDPQPKYKNSGVNTEFGVGTDIDPVTVVEDHVPTTVVEDRVPIEDYVPVEDHVPTTVVEDHVPTSIVEDHVLTSIVEDRVPTSIVEDRVPLQLGGQTHEDVGKDIVSRVNHFLFVNQSNERNISLFEKLIEKMDEQFRHKTLYVLTDNKDFLSDIKRFILQENSGFDTVKQVDLEYLTSKRKGSKKWCVIIDYDSIDENFLSLKSTPFNFFIFVDRYSSEIWNFTNHLEVSLLSYIPKGKIANRTLYKKVLRDFAQEINEEIVGELAGKSIITYDYRNLVIM